MTFWACYIAFVLFIAAVPIGFAWHIWWLQQIHQEPTNLPCVIELYYNWEDFYP